MARQVNNCEQLSPERVHYSAQRASSASLGHLSNRGTSLIFKFESFTESDSMSRERNLIVLGLMTVIDCLFCKIFYKILFGKTKTKAASPLGLHRPLV